MDKYYYFVAQLPLLYFDKATNFTQENFLLEAKKWLDFADLAVLQNIDVNATECDEDSHYIYGEFKTFERQLRNELVEWRKSQKAGAEYKVRLFPTNILKEGNPLEVEKKLIKLRWDFIEEMECGHHFDIGILILYYLKLQLLDRMKAFDKVKGMEKFNQFIEVEI